MKYKIIPILMIVSVFAINDRDQTILENTREKNENGYNFKYSTSDGQKRQEIGRIEKAGENLILRMSGSYSYVSRDGSIFEVVYEADEDGYKPSIHFKPSPINITIKRLTEEQDSQMTQNSSSDKPVMPVDGEVPSILETTLAPEFNTTERPGIALLIGSAAIASLAGGGLG